MIPDPPHLPSALIVAHPGHELLVSAYLRRSRPLVLILTDGSGRASPPRIEHSRRLVESVGALPGPFFGAHSDREFYQAVLRGDTAFFVSLSKEIAQILLQHRTRVVVADPYERQYLSHDICRLLAGAAAARLAQLCGGSVESLAYPMYGYHGQHEPAPRGPLIHLQLDDEELDWKIRSGRGIPDPGLQEEIEGMIAEIGYPGLAREVLIPVDARNGFDDTETIPPGYETHGEKLVAGGEYPAVIRYKEHVRPIVEALDAEIAELRSVPGSRLPA